MQAYSSRNWKGDSVARLVGLRIFQYIVLISVFLSGCGTQTMFGPPPPLQITIRGEELIFTPSVLSISANQPVVLTINNTSRTNAHTWVLLNTTQPAAIQQVQQAVYQAQQQPNAALLPGKPLPNNLPNVLAQTTVLWPGQSQDITVTLALGTYTYLCVIPGHSEAGMSGILTAQ